MIQEPVIHVEGQDIPLSKAREYLVHGVWAEYKHMPPPRDLIERLTFARLAEIIESPIEPDEAKLMARHVYALRKRLIFLNAFTQAQNSGVEALMKGLYLENRRGKRWMFAFLVAAAGLIFVVGRWTMGA